MLIINQNYKPDKSISRQFGEEINTLTVYKKAVQNDIAEMRNKYEAAKGMFNRSNIERIIGYLVKLESLISEDETLDICWCENKNGSVTTYPITLEVIKEYGINAIRYAVVDENSAVVYADNSMLADMIAYEMMYRDLGDNIEDIENELMECKITSVESSTRMRNLFSHMDISPYKLSRDIKVIDSPYKGIETGKLVKYFTCDEERLKENEKYHEVVYEVCKKINIIIMMEITSNVRGVTPLCVGDTYYGFRVDRDKLDKATQIASEVCIRVFGRTFNIGTELEVY